MAAGLLGIFLGAFGIHTFVLGYTTAGVIMLVVRLVTCGLGALAMGVIGLIEGISTSPKRRPRAAAPPAPGRRLPASAESLRAGGSAGD